VAARLIAEASADDAARPSEVVGEGFAKRGIAARVAVVQSARGCVICGVPDGRQPVPHRKEGHVRGGRGQIEPRDSGWRLLRGRSAQGWCRDRGDQRCRAWPHDNETLRLQLRVDVAGHPAGRTDLRCQLARGRKAHPGAQRPFADGVAQAAFERAAQRLAGEWVKPQSTGLID
jgi:hypothetical protein